jgi:hypothetical protein
MEARKRAEENLRRLPIASAVYKPPLKTKRKEVSGASTLVTRGGRKVQRVMWREPARQEAPNELEAEAEDSDEASEGEEGAAEDPEETESG